MPPLPAPQRRERYPVAQIPEPPVGAFGGPVQAVAHGLQNELDRIEVLEDRQRLTTFDIETQGLARDGIMKIREQAAAEPDPDKYKAIYDKGIADLQKQVVKQAGPDQRRQNIGLDNYGKAVSAELDNIIAGTTARRRDTVLAAVEKLSRIGRERVAEGQDPKDIISQFDKQIDTAPYLMRDEQEKLKGAFKDRLSRDYLEDQARKNPIDFGARAEAGDFKGLNQDYLDNALSIAGRLLADRDRRESKADQARADAAERAFTERAQAHQLNEDDLAAAATWYKWDRDKVDKILKTQYGIRESSPYAGRLIADAMQPANKVAPSLEDIKQAEANMADITDRVSSKSREYEQGITRLRGIRDNLLRARGPDNTLRTAAGKRLGIMLDLYHIDDKKDEDWVSKTLAPIRETMRTMDPNKLDAYLDGLERLWKVETQEIKIEQGVRERFRGIGKKP